MENTPREGQRIYRSKVDASGRIVLPAELRSELDLHEGDSRLVVKDGTMVRIETVQQALRTAQEYFCRLAPPDRLLSEELLCERREEAERV